LGFRGILKNPPITPKLFYRILLVYAAQIVPQAEQDDFLCILTGAKKIFNLLMQIIAVCFACGYR
jgi:hypothetical protein